MEKQAKLEESMKLLEAHSFAELMRNFIEYSDEDLPPMMRSLEEFEAKMKAIAPPLFPSDLSYDQPCKKCGNFQS